MLQNARERILSASLDLFSEKGYKSVSTSEIAEKAGVNEITIFRIFRKKKNLYTEVFYSFRMKPDPQDFLGNITYIPEDDLKAFASAFLKLFICNTKIVNMSFRVVQSEFREIADELKQQIMDISSIIKPYFIELKSKGLLLSDDPGFLAVLFTDILFGYSLQLLKNGKLDILPSGIKELSSVFARGIINNR